MQKINVVLGMLLVTGTLPSLQAVKIEIKNATNKTIAADLYEAVEQQSTLGEPELEGWAKEIAPGKTGVIEADLSAEVYQLNAHDAGTSVFETTRGRKLDIEVGNNDDVFHVTVNNDSINFSGNEVSQRRPAYRQPHRYGRRYPLRATE